jgi:hypothetical protein
MTVMMMKKIVISDELQKVVHISCYTRIQNIRQFAV